MKKLILTVCNGNIHRSVIAEEVIRKILYSRRLDGIYRVESRGIQGTGGIEPALHKNLRDYPEEWKLTSEAMHPYGIEISEEKASTPISRADAEIADIILAMDEKTLSNETNGLQKQFPDLKGKMILFTELGASGENLPDPHGITDPELYVKLVRIIYNALFENFDQLIKVG